jgi:hypothetical protein
VIALILLTPLPALAGNVGFRFWMPLREGFNFVGLPYLYYPNGNMHAPEQNAQNLCSSATGVSGCVTRDVTHFTTFGPYTANCGTPFSNFRLTPGEGVVVRVNEACELAMIGSHDDRYAFGRGAETIGLSPVHANLIAVPYHTVQQTAQELCSFINDNFGTGSDLIALTRFSPVGPLFVPCGHPFLDFDLVVGEALFFTVGATMEVQFEVY